MNEFIRAYLDTVEKDAKAHTESMSDTAVKACLPDVDVTPVDNIKVLPLSDALFDLTFPRSATIKYKDGLSIGQLVALEKENLALLDMAAQLVSDSLGHGDNSAVSAEDFQKQKPGPDRPAESKSEEVIVISSDEEHNGKDTITSNSMSKTQVNIVPSTTPSQTMNTMMKWSKDKPHHQKQNKAVVVPLKLWVKIPLNRITKTLLAKFKKKLQQQHGNGNNSKTMPAHPHHKKIMKCLSSKKHDISPGRQKRHNWQDKVSEGFNGFSSDSISPGKARSFLAIKPKGARIESNSESLGKSVNVIPSNDESASVHDENSAKNICPSIKETPGRMSSNFLFIDNVNKCVPDEEKSQQTSVSMKHRPLRSQGEEETSCGNIPGSRFDDVTSFWAENDFSGDQTPNLEGFTLAEGIEKDRGRASQKDYETNKEVMKSPGEDIKSDCIYFPSFSMPRSLFISDLKVGTSPLMQEENTLLKFTERNKAFHCEPSSHDVEKMKETHAMEKIIDDDNVSCIALREQVTAVRKQRRLSKNQRFSGDSFSSYTSENDAGMESEVFTSPHKSKPVFGKRRKRSVQKCVSRKKKTASTSHTHSTDTRHSRKSLSNDQQRGPQGKRISVERYEQTLQRKCVGCSNPPNFRCRESNSVVTCLDSDEKVADRRDKIRGTDDLRSIPAACGVENIQNIPSTSREEINQNTQSPNRTENIQSTLFSSVTEDIQSTLPPSGAENNQSTPSPSEADNNQSTPSSSGTENYQSTPSTNGTNSIQSTPSTSGPNSIQSTPYTGGTISIQSTSSTSGTNSIQSPQAAHGMEKIQRTSATSGTNSVQSTPTSGTDSIQSPLNTSGKENTCTIKSTPDTSGTSSVQSTPNSGSDSIQSPLNTSEKENTCIIQSTPDTSGTSSVQSTPTSGADSIQSPLNTNGKMKIIQSTPDTSGTEKTHNTSSLMAGNSGKENKPALQNTRSESQPLSQTSDVQGSGMSKYDMPETFETSKSVYLSDSFSSHTDLFYLGDDGEDILLDSFVSQLDEQESENCNPDVESLHQSHGYDTLLYNKEESKGDKAEDDSKEFMGLPNVFDERDCLAIFDEFDIDIDNDLFGNEKEDNDGSDLSILLNDGSQNETTTCAELEVQGNEAQTFHRHVVCSPGRPAENAVPTSLSGIQSPNDTASSHPIHKESMNDSDMSAFLTQNPPDYNEPLWQSPPADENLSGNLTVEKPAPKRLIVPHGYCYNFLNAGVCAFGLRCRFKHTRPTAGDMYNHASEAIDTNLKKGNVNWAMCAYRSLREITCENLLPSSLLLSLLSASMDRGSIADVFFILNEITQQNLFDKWICNRVIRLCWPQHMMYRSDLEKIFFAFMSLSITPDSDCKLFMLHLFHAAKNQTLLWELLCSLNETEGFIVPAFIMIEALEYVVGHPNPELMAKYEQWVCTAHPHALSHLDQDILASLQDRLCQVAPHCAPALQRLTESLIQSTERTFQIVPEKCPIVSVDSMTQSQLEEYKAYFHRISGCAQSLNWTYLGETFVELCNKRAPSNHHYTAAYVTALQDTPIHSDTVTNVKTFLSAIKREKHVNVLLTVDTDTLSQIICLLISVLFNGGHNDAAADLVELVMKEKLLTFVEYSSEQTERSSKVNRSIVITALQISILTKKFELGLQIVEENKCVLGHSTSPWEQGLLLRCVNDLTVDVASNMDHSYSELLMLKQLVKCCVPMNKNIVMTGCSRLFDVAIRSFINVGDWTSTLEVFQVLQKIADFRNISPLLVRRFLSCCVEAGIALPQDLYAFCARYADYPAQMFIKRPTRQLCLQLGMTIAEIKLMVDHYLHTLYSQLCCLISQGHGLTVDDMFLNVKLIQGNLQSLDTPFLGSAPRTVGMMQSLVIRVFGNLEPPVQTTVNPQTNMIDILPEDLCRFIQQMDIKGGRPKLLRQLQALMKTKFQA